MPEPKRIYGKIEKENQNKIIKSPELQTEFYTFFIVRQSFSKKHLLKIQNKSHPTVIHLSSPQPHVKRTQPHRIHITHAANFTPHPNIFHRLTLAILRLHSSFACKFQDGEYAAPHKSTKKSKISSKLPTNL